MSRHAPVTHYINAFVGVPCMNPNYIKCMDEAPLEPILEYNMTPDEAAAYKLCLMWIVLSRKVFPEYNHVRLPKGDPRKGSLFRYCYKLWMETKSTLPPEDYKLYMRAQLDVVKVCGGNMIGSHILVGPKAWKRWKLWKKRYDELSRA